MRRLASPELIAARSIGLPSSVMPDAGGAAKRRAAQQVSSGGRPAAAELFGEAFAHEFEARVEALEAERAAAG